MKRTARDKPAAIVAIQAPEMLLQASPGVKAYRMGDCGIFVAREPMGFQTSPVAVTVDPPRWHLSISHPSRYPSWDEMSEARDHLLPGELVFAILFPAKWNQYVNAHPNCFHLWEIHDRDG